ncbi:MAG: hypothetical protein RSE36_05590, partial [Oscillospiraceae bacterium]
MEDKNASNSRNVLDSKSEISAEAQTSSPVRNEKSPAVLSAKTKNAPSKKGKSDDVPAKNTASSKPSDARNFEAEKSGSPSAAASGSSKVDDKKAACKSPASKSGGSHKGAKASSFRLENKADFVQSIQNQLETEECAEYGGTPVSAAQKAVSGFRGTFEDRAFRKKFAITLSIVFGAVVWFFVYAVY